VTRPTPAPIRPDRGRRFAALLALLALVGAFVAGLLILVNGGLWRVVVAVVLIGVAVAAMWYLVAARGARRIAGGVVAASAGIGLLVVGLSAPHHSLALALAIGLVVISGPAAKRALGRDAASLSAASSPGSPVAPGRHSVLIMNPWSGGGKVERFNLVEECGKRDIEPIVLRRGDDLLKLARDAIAGGADVIGMAGGDGSQALVATVAAEHDIPHVCIPAGTRNHFALDLGLDRDDVVGALDAYGEALERRIDLATVNGRVFVNNASMGVYAKIVQSADYRDAKMKTAAAMLPDMIGPDAEPFDLRFAGPDGREMPSADMILVSNDPYELDHLGGRGSRPKLDTGTLGVASARIDGARDAVEFVRLESVGRIRRFSGWMEWEAPSFQVDSGGPIEIGIDGEATVIDPPLVFESRPGALRIRTPMHAPGVSPAAVRLPGLRTLVPELVAVVSGRNPVAG
jgi:diacylglycerol kinase family enzyme